VFVGFYLISMAMAQAGSIFLGYRLTPMVTFILLIAALAPAIQLFLKREGRAPSKGELLRYASLGAVGSTIACIILNAMSRFGQGAGRLEQILGSADVGTTAYFLGIHLLSCWVLIFLCSDMYAKDVARLFVKKQEVRRY
jgi:hypothetical protein